MALSIFNKRKPDATPLTLEQFAANGAAAQAAVNPIAQARAPAPVTDEPAADEIFYPRLAALAPSAGNPRKTFDETDMAELTASIVAHGVLEPITVRHAPQSGAIAKYEIIFGERRVRAAGQAGLRVIPAVLKTWSDAKVRQVRLIENEQRADLSPLERADGYAEMIEKDGLTPEEIATQVGKSARTIQECLKLRSLPPKAKEALAAGALETSVAGLIARVPGDAAKAKCAAMVLAGYSEHDYRTGKNNRRPLTLREVRNEIATEFSVELRGAPFERKEAGLVAAVPSCDSCPKRVGNLQKDDPDGYAGVRADVCTDPACYGEKVEAWKARMIAQAKERGQQILTKERMAAIFPYRDDQIARDADIVDLAEELAWDHHHALPKAKNSGKRPTYAALLDPHLQPEHIAIGVDRGGTLHRLVSKAAAVRILTEHHGARFSSRNGRAPLSAADKKAAAKRKAEAKLETAVSRAQLEELAAAAERVAQAKGEAVKILLRAMIRASSGWSGVRDDILHRRGCTGRTTDERTKTLEKQCENMGGPALFALLAELRVGDLVLAYHGGGEELAKALKLTPRAEHKKRLAATAKGAK